jgi:hypothetical protein
MEDENVSTNFHKLLIFSIPITGEKTFLCSFVYYRRNKGRPNRYNIRKTQSALPELRTQTNLFTKRAVEGFSRTMAKPNTGLGVSRRLKSPEGENKKTDNRKNEGRNNEKNNERN